LRPTLRSKQAFMNVAFISCLRARNLPEPVAEFAFHPSRKWRFDYAWPELKIALEVEGGLWLARHGKKSRHFTGTGAAGDMEKYNQAALYGWRVVRSTPTSLTNDATLAFLALLLAGKTPTHTGQGKRLKSAWGTQI